MSHPAETVVILGTRPASLSLAVALLQQGVKPRIVESIKCGLDKSLVVTILSPEVLRSLELLGVLPEVFQRSHVLNITTTPESRGQGTSDTLVLTRGSRAIKLEALKMILERRVIALGGRIEKIFKIVSVRANETRGCMTCLLRAQGDGQGRGGQEITVNCEFVIDTEGSILDTPSICLISEGDANASLTQIQDAEVLGLEHSVHAFQHADKYALTLIPLGPPQHFTVVLEAGAAVDYPAQHDTPDVASLGRIFRQALGRDDVKVRAVNGMSHIKNRVRIVRSLLHGRILFLGGGAYTLPLFHGSDTGSGINDALNLGWKLSLVCKGQSPRDLLNSYDSERLPGNVSRIPHRRSVSMLSPIHANVAALQAMPRVARIPSLLKGEVNDGGPTTSRFVEPLFLDFAMNYRRSAIVTDDREFNTNLPIHSNTKPVNTSGANDGITRVCAGDRAPDIGGLAVICGPGFRGGSTKRPQRLYELLSQSSGGHTILVFPPSGGGGVDDEEHGRNLGEALQVLEMYVLRDGAQVVFILPDNYLYHPPAGVEITIAMDPSGRARRAFGLDGVPAGHEFGTQEMVYVVVRPDGFIGCFGTEVASVERYFSDIYCC